MTTITATNPRSGEASAALISRSGWLWIIGLGGLFIALHHVLIVRMLRVATNAKGDDLFTVLWNAPFSKWNPDWSHAMVVPLISAYYIYLKRDTIRHTTARLYWPGLAVVFLGLISYSFWIYPGRNDMFQGYSMILTLLGVVLFVLGPGQLRTLWFPVVYLSFAVKIADRIWEQIAWKLQLLASHSAAFILNVLGIDAEITGSTIELYRGLEFLGKLNVAEACSGLRMLMAFLALGVALAFLIERRWWERAVMCLCAVPIAVGVNIGRVTILGLLYLIDPKWASGDFHTFIGLLMLLPAAGLFLLLGWIMDKLIIEDPDAVRKTKPQSPGQSPLPETHTGDWLPRVLPGVGLGALLAVLVGLTYAAGVVANRPDLILSDPAASGMVSLALIAAPFVLLALLIACVWWARRWSLKSAKPQLVGLAMLGGVLLAAIFGQNAVLAATQAVLIKEAVPLRSKLYLLPREVGLWEQLGTDDVLGDDIVDELGTRDYVSRAYQNTAAPSDTPGSVVRLHVAYYTGTPDTVPHVPDRCFVAGGLQPLNLTSSELTIANSSYQRVGDGWETATRMAPGTAYVPESPVTATVFTYGMGDNAQRKSNVLYFFAANGKYMHTPELVRLNGFDPRDRHAYFCKIEVGVPGVGDPQEASRVAEAFLTRMLPEIMACLPDWREVKAGRYPLDIENSNTTTVNTDP